MIEIKETVPENQRQRAGEIYYEAFRRKLRPLLGKPAETRRVLASGFSLDMAVGAFSEGNLLGLAGLHNHKGVFLRVTLHDCLAQFSLARGLYAWAVLSLFGAGKCPPDHLRIAAIAVDEKARGQGLGSKLMEAIFGKARREGFKAVRLEVVDTKSL